MLRLVVVWYLAGDDVEMSSDGHENRKLEGDAGGRAQRIPPQGVRSVKALEPKQAPYNEAIQQPIID